VHVDDAVTRVREELHEFLYKLEATVNAAS
jgi:hypothetical protein